jgi:hypothetical protein
MDQQFIPTAKPTIEDVRQRFEQWRESRKQHTPIPESLWKGAASLCADHSIYKISRSLHLDYNALKRHVYSSHSESLSESVTSSVFVELDLKASLPEAECFVEREDKDGAKMKMHIKGRLCLDPLEFIKAFWGRGDDSDLAADADTSFGQGGGFQKRDRRTGGYLPADLGSGPFFGLRLCFSE